MRSVLTLAPLSAALAPAVLAAVSVAGRPELSPLDAPRACAAASPSAAVAAAADDSTARRLVEALRGGGHVIVLRHAHTDRSKMDDHAMSLADRATQRNLSDRGFEEAATLGRAAGALGVPVGEVLASPMFRTRETAERAFGRADTTELLRTRGSAPEARALLTAPPAAGTNRVLVTHNAYIHRYLGAAGHGQIGEGDAVVVRPMGDAGFEVLGRIRVDEWGRLAPAPR